MPTLYAFVWRAHESDATFDDKTFIDRLPRLLLWLRELKAKNVLVACGGGGFEEYAGGMTVIRADSPDHARELFSGDPMLEIGTHDLLVWDVFYADLVDHASIEKLTS